MLCGVSREFRNEISRTHYSSNSFISEFYDRLGPEQIASWAEAMGRGSLEHIRDLKMSFDYHKGFFDTFHLTYDTANGLKAEVIESKDYSYDDRDEKAEQHLDWIERRRQDGTLEGTGILDFFIANLDGLRSILWSPLYKIGHDEEDAEGYFHETVTLLNERDAYGVAYGECYRDYPY